MPMYCIEAAVGGQMIVRGVRGGRVSIPTRINLTALFRPLPLQLLAQVDGQLTQEKNFLQHLCNNTFAVKVRHRFGLKKKRVVF